MSGFSGLYVGLSSLVAQRRAIEVAGHNLSNVGTEGYSRQRVEMTADAGPITPAMFARYEGTGMGVRSGTISRLRDDFMELRGYQEHASLSHTERVQGTLSRIESALGEPTDTGLAAQLADYWAGWDDVGNQPSDVAARAQLLERASTLATSFRKIDDDLETLRGQTIDQLTATVDEVNATAARIAELNGTIQSTVLSGLNANDLMDQRDLLVSQLAEKVGVTIRPGDNGSVSVFVGGTALVAYTQAEKLQVTDEAGTIEVQWAKDGLAAGVDGGAAGMLDSINDIIPRYRDELTAVTNQLLTETNALHTTGFDQDGNAGLPFFVMGTNGIEVNPSLVGQPRRVAASEVAGTLDGKIASKLATSNVTDSQYRKLVVGLGVEAQSANRRVEIQSAITAQVDAARESQSGVNIDEEMTNLVAYQHAYNAAARFVTTIDEMLDTIVNRLGV